MSTTPITHDTPSRRRSSAAYVGSTLTALTTVALLGGTLSPAAAAPVEQGAALRAAAPVAAKVAAHPTTRIKVGKSSHTLAGTNVARKANKLVVYKAPRKATPRTRAGVDAVVLKGKVKSLKVHKATRKGKKGVSVPRGGYVVSGYGSTARWLRAVARPGVKVSYIKRQPMDVVTPTQPVPSTPAPSTPAPSTPAPSTPAPSTPAPSTPAPSTPAPSTPVTVKLPTAGQTVSIGGSSSALSGVNVDRDVDNLIVYGSPVTVTPTNMWGVEVGVVGGKVVSVNDRQLNASTTGTPVPAGGYVLSGHNTAGDWLRDNAKVGATVAVSNMPATPAPSTPAPSTPAPSTPAPSTPSTGTTSSSPMALPAKVQAAYYMMWSNSPHIRLTDIPSNVNVVNLAFIQGTTLVDWGPYGKAQTIADAKTLRARGVRIVASVGGAGGDVNLANRQAFIAGVKAISAQLPLDGIDWDVEQGSFNSADVVAISSQLKQDFGSNFAITMAPNGSNVDNYLNIAVQLQKAGALDMYGQQFYDAQVSKEAAKGRVDQAVGAGIPQSKISVGMMVGTTSNYWTVDQCVTNMKYIKASYPNIRGGYLWEAGRVGTTDWATRLAPILMG